MGRSRAAARAAAHDPVGAHRAARGPEWIARYEKLPVPALQARTNVALTRRFAKAVGATGERVRQDLAELPGNLDRVDQLIADGTISLEQPNAATFQIGTTIRALGLFRHSRRSWRDEPAATWPTLCFPTTRRRPWSCRPSALDLDVPEIVALDDRDLGLSAVGEADGAPERAPLLDLDPRRAIH